MIYKSFYLIKNQASPLKLFYTNSTINQTRQLPLNSCPATLDLLSFHKRLKTPTHNPPNQKT